MVNQFEGEAYSEYCHGASSSLEAIANMLPGPALAPPTQLAAMAGARRTVASSHAARACADAAPGSVAAAMGSTGCTPLLGSDLLNTFELDKRDKWVSLGWAALTIPALCLAFYLGVRNVRHEHR